MPTGRHTKYTGGIAPLQLETLLLLLRISNCGIDCSSWRHTKGQVRAGRSTKARQGKIERGRALGTLDSAIGLLSRFQLETGCKVSQARLDRRPR